MTYIYRICGDPNISLAECYDGDVGCGNVECRRSLTVTGGEKRNQIVRMVIAGSDGSGKGRGYALSHQVVP